MQEAGIALFTEGPNRYSLHGQPGQPRSVVFSWASRRFHVLRVVCASMKHKSVESWIERDLFFRTRDRRSSLSLSLSFFLSLLSLLFLSSLSSLSLFHPSFWRVWAPWKLRYVQRLDFFARLLFAQTFDRPSWFAIEVPGTQHRRRTRTQPLPVDLLSTDSNTTSWHRETFWRKAEVSHPTQNER